MNGLMITSDGAVVTREQVEAVPVPRATRSYHPLPFMDLTDMLHDTFEANGFKVGEIQHCLARKNTQYFGLAEILNLRTETEKAVACWRSSYNKTLKPEGIGGASVTACTNLDVWGGMYEFGRKQTTFIMTDIRERMQYFVSQFEVAHRERAVQVELYKTTLCNEEKMSLAVKRLYDAGVINTQRIGKVFDEYNEPSYPEHFGPNGERTVWTLFNAVTESFKGSPVNTYAERCQGLHKVSTLVTTALRQRGFTID
jgi:hypothetical protein